MQGNETLTAGRRIYFRIIKITIMTKIRIIHIVILVSIVLLEICEYQSHPEV